MKLLKNSRLHYVSAGTLTQELMLGTKIFFASTVVSTIILWARRKQSCYKTLNNIYNDTFYGSFTAASLDQGVSELTFEDGLKDAQAYKASLSL